MRAEVVAEAPTTARGENTANFHVKFLKREKSKMSVSRSVPDPPPLPRLSNSKELSILFGNRKILERLTKN